MADIKGQAELEKASTALDMALFDAYKWCDLEKFASFFWKTRSFITLGRANLTESVKKIFAGK